MNQHNQPKEEEPKEAPKPKVIQAPNPVQKEKSLLEEIKDLKKFKEDILGTETELPKKGFKFPGKVKRQTRNLKKLAQKNKVQVILIKRTGDLIPTMGEIKFGMLMVGENFHNGDGDITYRWNGKIPTCIVPEWDLQPVTMDTLMKSTDELKTKIDAQQINIRIIEVKEIMDKLKGNFNWKGLLIIVGILALGYFMFFRGG